MKKIAIICGLLAVSAMAFVPHFLSMDFIKSTDGTKTWHFPLNSDTFAGVSQISSRPLIKAWVDPVFGSDSNPGSQVLPYQTPGACETALLTAGASENNPGVCELVPGNHNLANVGCQAYPGIMFIGDPGATGYYNQPATLYCNNGTTQPIQINFGVTGGDVYFVNLSDKDASFNFSGFVVTSQLSTTNGFSEVNFSGCRTNQGITWLGSGANNDFLEIFGDSDIHNMIIDSVGVDFDRSAAGSGVNTFSDTAGNGGTYFSAAFSNMNSSTNTFTSTTGQTFVQLLQSPAGNATFHLTGSGASISYSSGGRPGTLTTSGGATENIPQTDPVLSPAGIVDQSTISANFNRVSDNGAVGYNYNATYTPNSSGQSTGWAAVNNDSNVILPSGSLSSNQFGLLNQITIGNNGVVGTGTYPGNTMVATYSGAYITDGVIAANVYGSWSDASESNGGIAQNAYGVTSGFVNSQNNAGPDSANHKAIGVDIGDSGNVIASDSNGVNTAIGLFLGPNIFSFPGAGTGTAVAWSILSQNGNSSGFQGPVQIGNASTFDPYDFEVLSTGYNSVHIAPPTQFDSNVNVGGLLSLTPQACGVTPPSGPAGTLAITCTFTLCVYTGSIYQDVTPAHVACTF